MTSHTTRLAAAATGALLALTAACGSGGSTGASGASGGSSSSAASASASAEPLTASDIGQRLPAALKKAGTFSFQTRGSTAGQMVQGEGRADVSGDQVASDVTVEVAGQQLDARLVDGVFYLKGAALRTGGKWLKVDPSAKGPLSQVFGTLGAGSDPTKILGALSKASKVREVGHRSVGGTATTVYDVALPTSALGSALGLPASVVKALPDTVTFRLYVDDADRLRREDSSITVAGTTSTSQVTFDHYGEKVSITAPPAGQTTTRSPFAGSGVPS